MLGGWGGRGADKSISPFSQKCKNKSTFSVEAYRCLLTKVALLEYCWKTVFIIIIIYLGQGLIMLALVGLGLTIWTD